MLREIHYSNALDYYSLDQIVKIFPNLDGEKPFLERMV